MDVDESWTGDFELISDRQVQLISNFSCQLSGVQFCAFCGTHDTIDLIVPELSFLSLFHDGGTRRHP